MSEHNLEDLQIQETGISASGLNELGSLSSLRHIIISVWTENFGYDFLLELSMQMPNCTILAKGNGAFFRGEFDGEWT